ncbi:unnamed protein product [Meganyctiphanes norvegica]|uniref:Major facilitator superfamily (MFS) profile domain-containing protein n=1 Tax=Meganyctiphanes norvegica TaxID=48144 RepID=A0AAV2QA67_MEGNR
MEEQLASPARLTQYIAGFSASLGALGMGTVIGYSSPALPYLTGNATDTVHLDPQEAMWFSSILNVGALIGGPVAGVCMNNIGRRGTMIASIIPFLLGWGLIGFGENFIMLLAGRILTGMCCGIVSLVVNVYIGEFASPDIRGALGTGFQLLVVTGVLYSFAFGAFLSWRMLVIACIVVPCLFAGLMLLGKESPVYLLIKGRCEEAKTSLQYFRGKNYPVDDEFKEMRQSVNLAMQNKIQLSDLLKPYYLKPMGISLMLMFYQQFSGINAIMFNLVTIFETTGSSMSTTLSSCLVALVQVVGTFSASLLMDRAGRKILLITSATLMAASLFSIGAFFYLLEYNESVAEKITFVPLLSLIVFIAAFSIGYGPVPFLMMGELFSPEVREVAGSIAIAANWTSSFIVTLMFQPMQAVIHNYGVYWVFGSICVTNLIFSILVVPETKGKTLDEISIMFGAPAKSPPIAVV